MVESLGFSIFSIMSPANNDSFTSSFPIEMPLISFPCLIAVARPSNTVLKVVRMHIVVLLMILRKKAFSFSLSMMVSCGFIVYDLYYVGLRPLNPHFADGFDHKWCCILSDVYSGFQPRWRRRRKHFTSSHNQKEGNNQFKNKEQPELPENHLHGSPTTKELKKIYSYGRVGGMETAAWGEGTCSKAADCKGNPTFACS